MKITLNQSEIAGVVKAPTSKSMMQRAIAAALLSKGRSVLYYPSFCGDCKAAIHLAREMGAEIDITDEVITVTGGLKQPKNVLNCGESGLAIRMFGPIAALFAEPVALSGNGTLSNRPMHIVEAALKQFGVDCLSHDGFIPITLRGPLKGGKATVDGTISSQVLTGLLMALPMADKDSEIRTHNLKSKPYIDMTIAILEKFGITIENINHEFFKIPGRQEYMACNYEIEGDWSAGAFWLVAGAIGGDIRIKNLDLHSKQADLKILSVLKIAGAEISLEPDTIRIRKSKLIAFEFDATDCPDLFPPLVVLAANCIGTSMISGVHRLIHKESNRTNALVSEFGKMGILIEVRGDVMYVTGGKIKDCDIQSHNDHRIAMACAIASLNVENQIIINDFQCVSKSYPDFFQHLEILTQQNYLISE